MIDVQTCFIVVYKLCRDVFLLIYRFLVCGAVLLKLPGPPSSKFMLNNVGPLKNQPPEEMFVTLREWSRKFAPVYKLFIFPIITANITGPEDCAKILSNPRQMNKGPLYWLVQRWLKSGLLTSTGRKWQTRRKILTPAFHFSILQKFVPIFNEETDVLIEAFKEEMLTNPVIEINKHITQFTLKSIAETAMGVKLNFQTQEQLDYKNAVYEMGKMVLYKVLRPWIFMLESCFIRSDLYRKETGLLNILHGYTRKVIQEREEQFSSIPLNIPDDIYVNKKRFAMLDLMLSAKKDSGIIDDAGIQEEVDTFLFEGHDTTSIALSFALMLIACNRNVQQKIVQELEEILGEDLAQKPTLHHLQQMKYLERCIKEVVRLYPSVPFIARELGEGMRTKNGFLLPAGSIVHIHIYDVHRIPEIYPEPEKFDPDRFLPEQVQNRHPFAYLGFSAGSRNCIGQRFAMLELKTALAGILANFVLEPVDTPDTVVLIVDIVLRTKGNINVKFLPRRST